MNNTLQSSTDIWFCAFLMLKGHKINNYKVIGRGKVRCEFDITSDEWQQLKLEFNNSDLIKYKSLVDQIKDLAF